MKRMAALVVALAVLGVTVWLVWPSGPGVQGQEQRITVVDGPNDDQKVDLDTTFFPPAQGGKAPAVLLAHGFGSAKESMRNQARQLAEAGYAVLTWSARGFGKSTGQIALNSPDYEVKDVKQLIDWLAKRPEVLLDKEGDPRVGMAGGSYGGAISLMTAAYDDRVDAIVPQITWYDLADALFPNGTGQGPESGVFKKAWAGFFFGRGGIAQGSGLQGGLEALNRQVQPLSPEEARCGRFLPEICDVYQQIASTGKATPEAVALLRKSSPVSVQGRIKAPTLLIQGQRDSLFTLAQADGNARAVAGPVQVMWFDGGHDGGNGEVDYLYEKTLGWLDRWLKQQPQPEGPAFSVTRDGGRDPGTRQRIRLHPETAQYPGLSGTMTTPVELRGPEQNIVNPPGGTPPSISTVPGVGGLLGGGGSGGGGQSNLSVSLDMPGQSAVFESAPLTRPLQLTGGASAKIRVYGKGEVTLFGKLYDVSDSLQPPNLPSGQISPVKVTIPEGADSVEATITLPVVDYLFPAGHRMRLALTTTDMGFSTPAEPASYRVALADPALAVPSVKGLSEPPPGLAWWVWAMPLAAIVVAAAVLATGRTRRARAGTASDVPLEITGLTKAYSNGFKAVDDLSFRVEQGQVLGLLGPNGAGKTTTMRMMMGLIHPDGGTIRIFGEEVTPGAPVLSRLGSFVEGPGFLPHLSGRENLDLYWAATGRPASEAHFDEALEIAGLGNAINRAVRTYSQGMRQRLAIAQAMLGLPDLLVLDEPTNGLDPPQIREMREVLKRYAQDGRTVIVSSHLLAEVEQTCSHVVVMHRGKLVSEGPVARLLATSNGHGPRLEDVFLDLIGEK
ncbi:alpha/beta fold hydrolase [Nonomuraea soli]|uniref:ABC-2 type transport system ATP-binding protein n=1 Tax=Nonomuraea soli TaxID=1032476 RepID=A0A7W0CND8_9ACTN|nr:alpha/beta fold hydrolase [Nonomuraea soli]MBA2894315.1 ABC-2 type transport system ATP-binding protein [Nonomuraea soli]